MIFPKGTALLARSMPRPTAPLHKSKLEVTLAPCSKQSQAHLVPQDARDAERESLEEAAVQAAFALAAQYIVLAGMLQPAREVYRRSLGVVQPLLPLPYLRQGLLRAASPSGSSIEERCAPAAVGDGLFLEMALKQLLLLLLLRLCLLSGPAGSMSLLRFGVHRPRCRECPALLTEHMMAASCGMMLCCAAHDRLDMLCSLCSSRTWLEAGVKFGHEAVMADGVHRYGQVDAGTLCG